MYIQISFCLKKRYKIDHGEFASTDCVQRAQNLYRHFKYSLNVTASGRRNCVLGQKAQKNLDCIVLNCCNNASLMMFCKVMYWKILFWRMSPAGWHHTSQPVDAHPRAELAASAASPPGSSTWQPLGAEKM